MPQDKPLSFVPDSFIPDEPNPLDRLGTEPVGWNLPTGRFELPKPPTPQSPSALGTILQGANDFIFGPSSIDYQGRTYPIAKDAATHKSVPGLQSLANWIDPPQGVGGYTRGAIAGGLEGVGNLLASTTDPAMWTRPGSSSIVPEVLPAEAARGNIDNLVKQLVDYSEAYKEVRGRGFQPEQLALPPAPEPRLPGPPAGPFVSGESGMAAPRMYDIDFGQNPDTFSGTVNPVQFGELTKVPPEIAAKYGTTLGKPEVISKPEGYYPSEQFQGVRAPLSFQPDEPIPTQTDITKPTEPTSPGPNIAQEIDDARARGYTVISPSSNPRIDPAYEVKGTLSNGALVIGKKEPMASFGPRVDENILSRPVEPSEEIQSAKIGEGRAQIGVNVRHSAAELTKGYSNPPPHVMSREGMQNALDAVKDLGLDGQIRVTFNDDITVGDKTISMADNGRGMSPEELYTVYTDLHSSGKTADMGATGGKGVGKATYMLGGEYFKVNTVKEINGQKVESWFKGTPEELLSGFDIKSKVVDPSTPTGTKFTTTLKNEHDMYDARNAMSHIIRYSRDKQGTLAYKRSTLANHENHSLLGDPRDKKVVDNEPVDRGNTNIDVYIPHDSPLGRHASLQIEYLNNGMWQYTNHYFPLGEETNGIPEKIIVNVKPNVAELSDEYPFPVQRESIKTPIQNEIDKIIKDKLVAPFANTKKRDLVKLWGQMKAVPAQVGKTARESVFFDPGDRLTPEESLHIQNSKDMGDMLRTTDSLFNEILIKLGKQANIDKLVRTGISMDPERYGVHIPNPGAPKAESAIFVNPFEHIKNNDPADAALDLVTTALHEAAHIGTEGSPRTNIKIEPADLNDPRVGRYLQTYLNQVMTQGGVDMGHGMSFIHRLGEIYAKTGTGTALRYSDVFEHIFTGGQPETGRYSPEIQKLLQIYEESRGRPATTEDILSGTGVKSAVKGTGEGNLPSSNRPNGKRTPIEDDPRYDEDYGIGPEYGEGNTGLAKQAINPFREIWNFGRSMTLGGDISYALRQGKPYVFHSAWYKSWIPAAKAFGDEAAYHMADEAIREHPWYDNAVKDGLFLADIGKRPGESMGLARGEFIESDLPERIPVLGHYYRATNRANTAFLNTLRMSVYGQMMDAAETLGANLDEMGPKYANHINTMTGHASLKFQGPQLKLGGRDVNLAVNAEKAAGFLGYTMMAPRFLASRLKMFTTFGLSTLPVPDAWIGMDPVLRQESLRNLFAVASLALSTYFLTKLAGGKVEDDPTSADYMKGRFGATRFDPLIGLQQYIVLAARMIKGTSKSTETGEKYVLGQKYGYQDRTDVATRFMLNKAHPNIRFASELGRALQGDITKLNTWKNAKSYGKPFNLGMAPQHMNDPISRSMSKIGVNHQIQQYVRTPFENEFLKLFIPITLQDIYEVSKTNPNLLPVAIPASVLGESEQTYK